MRLTEYEAQAIKSCFLKVFGAGSIYLFGSRIDDGKKGGDIDLYIVPAQDFRRTMLLEKKLDFLVSLKSLIGEQKIDVVVATDENRLIEREALSKGIKL
ncbi:nucleotidyltransferase domain-containing protein [Caedibacter taeniospiralis]|uniref:nucleotidyltransferase domain-containing protein n=1 Tax=Caedibacter taeniospiralis TaxID=28907 RepID=UPI0037C124B0